MIDYNPLLAPPASPSKKGVESGIEDPSVGVNVRWQTSARPPTAEENALADALQAIFNAGTEDLAEIVAQLARRGVKAPAGGTAWTEESFLLEMRRLGA